MSLEVTDHTDQSRTYHVNGRVAQIILWLVRNADRVASPRSLRLVFNCAGMRVVRTEFTEVDEPGE